MPDLLPYLNELFRGLLGYSDLDYESNNDNVPGWDSLVSVNIALALSGEFKIEITEEDFSELTSVAKIIALVNSRKNETGHI